MCELAEYVDRYSTVAMRREKGILEVTLHTDGGSLVWGRAPHRELSDAFLDIGADPRNRVVILTGKGDSFCDQLEDRPQGLQLRGGEGWDKIYWEGKRLLQTLL